MEYFKKLTIGDVEKNVEYLRRAMAGHGEITVITESGVRIIPAAKIVKLRCPTCRVKFKIPEGENPESYHGCPLPRYIRFPK